MDRMQMFKQLLNCTRSSKVYSTSKFTNVVDRQYKKRLHHLTLINKLNDFHLFA